MAQEEKKFSFKIEIELLDEAHKKAKKEDLSLSQVVRRLLREWVKDDPPEEVASQEK
jgi:predicted HicB family RNase H-like nuclease